MMLRSLLALFVLVLVFGLGAVAGVYCPPINKAVNTVAAKAHFCPCGADCQCVGCCCDPCDCKAGK